MTTPVHPAGLTASGIRTGDGAHYDVDAIVYGTGFAIADRDATLVGARGLTVRQAWPDGGDPYLGIAVHGLPNYFVIGGPDARAQARDAARQHRRSTCRRPIPLAGCGSRSSSG